MILRHIQVYSQEVTQRQQRDSTKLVVEHTREVKDIHFIPSVIKLTNKSLSFLTKYKIALSEKDSTDRVITKFEHTGLKALSRLLVSVIHHVLIFLAGKGSRGQGQPTGIQ